MDRPNDDSGNGEVVEQKLSTTGTTTTTTTTMSGTTISSSSTATSIKEEKLPVQGSLSQNDYYSYTYNPPTTATVGAVGTTTTNNVTEWYNQDEYTGNGGANGNGNGDGTGESYGTDYRSYYNYNEYNEYGYAYQQADGSYTPATSDTLVSSDMYFYGEDPNNSSQYYSYDNTAYGAQEKSEQQQQLVADYQYWYYQNQNGNETSTMDQSGTSEGQENYYNTTMPTIIESSTTTMNSPWQEVYDPTTNQLYYYNTLTGETAWTL
jgi:hypothetical protein